MNRRKFLRYTGVLGGAGLLTGLYTWQVEPFLLEFTRVPMKIRNLPQALAGKTLMQISDIHIGTRSRDSYLKDSFLKAAAYQPDFVAYTGDFVTYDEPRQLDQLHELMRHAPCGRLGTTAVFGNHDYGARWKDSVLANNLEELLSNHQLRVLRNDQQVISGLNFIGIDDKWGTNFHPEKAMRHWNPQEASIVLCHNPDVMDLPVWEGYNGWVISGHTHGGQCKPPFLPPPLLPVENKRYSSGQFAFEDGRTLYINRALGYTWQVRFNVRPEITLFELMPA
ncbi:metallophosphoesterase [Niabella beijingensis]|uniref:metallophosphoesterase n=1 Tax=Niabella beijingensis TaxID=2872700 RepID=UPI001CC06B19|nr:metallophosphoesterase [Niabella beijingensis]MBZ4189556.1 metallophosphoesterase [Niabella beijingensis]